jgi:hypothetical protein
MLKLLFMAAVHTWSPGFDLAPRLVTTHTIDTRLKKIMTDGRQKKNIYKGRVFNMDKRVQVRLNHKVH